MWLLFTNIFQMNAFPLVCCFLQSCLYFTQRKSNSLNIKKHFLVVNILIWYFITDIFFKILVQLLLILIYLFLACFSSYRNINKAALQNSEILKKSLRVLIIKKLLHSSWYNVGKYCSRFSYFLFFTHLNAVEITLQNMRNS